MAARLAEIDERVEHRRADAAGGGDWPIVLINTFTVAPEDADRLLEVWAEDAAFMKRQPGFISAQIHRGIAGQLDLCQHRRLGVAAGAAGGVFQPGVPGADGALSRQHGDPAAPLPESGGARDLCRVAGKNRRDAGQSRGSEFGGNTASSTTRMSFARLTLNAPLLDCSTPTCTDSQLSAATRCRLRGKNRPVSDPTRYRSPDTSVRADHCRT